MYKVYAELALQGHFGQGPEAFDKLDELLDAKVSLGGGPPQRFGDLYKGEEGLRTIRDAIISYDKETKAFKADQERARKQRHAR